MKLPRVRIQHAPYWKVKMQTMGYGRFGAWRYKFGGKGFSLRAGTRVLSIRYGKRIVF